MQWGKVNGKNPLSSIVLYPCSNHPDPVPPPPLPVNLPAVAVVSGWCQQPRHRPRTRKEELGDQWRGRTGSGLMQQGTVDCKNPPSSFFLSPCSGLPDPPPSHMYQLASRSCSKRVALTPQYRPRTQEEEEQLKGRGQVAERGKG